VCCQISGGAAGGVYSCVAKQQLGAAVLRGDRLEQGGHLGGRATPLSGEAWL